MPMPVQGIPRGGFENLPDPVPYTHIAYDHVGRGVIGGYIGAPESLISGMTNGQSYSHTYNWTVPNNFNIDYLKIVGVMINMADASIAQAGKTDYVPGFKNAKPQFISLPDEGLDPSSDWSYEAVARDPNHKDLTITASNLPAWLSITDNGKGEAMIEGVAPAASGIHTFTLSVTDGDWTTDQEINLNVGAVSTSDLNLEEIRLSPNPTNLDVLQIPIRDLHDASFEITSIDGRTMTKGTVNSNQIDISALQASIYILNIVDGDTLYSGKFVRL